jgi:hypothetical protein
LGGFGSAGASISKRRFGDLSVDDFPTFFPTPLLKRFDCSSQLIMFDFLFLLKLFSESEKVFLLKSFFSLISRLSFS